MLNAVIAAGLLMLNCWPIVLVELNHTNPSSPYARIPAKRSAIFAGWPAWGVAAVSAMSMGLLVSARTAPMVGPNKGAKRHDGFR